MKTRTVARAAGRALLGAAFVILGGEAATSPGVRVDVAGPTLDKLRAVAPLVPEDDELLVRLNGGTQAMGGALLAAGVATGPAAAVIAATLVPTTIAGHNFWELDDPSAAKAQKIQFIKNAAMLGGLLLVVAGHRK